MWPDVSGAGQGDHAHVEGEPKDDLADGPAVAISDADQLGMGQHFAIGGQEREALIEQSIRGAELPNVAVPALLGVAPVLDKAGPDSVPGGRGPNLLKGDIADAEETGPAALLDGLHRPPGLPVGRRQSDPLGWAMEQEGIDHLDAQVLERAGERLLDLDRDGCLGVVGQAVILPPPESELGLKE